MILSNQKAQHNHEEGKEIHDDWPDFQSVQYSLDRGYLGMDEMLVDHSMELNDGHKKAQDK